MKLLEQVAEVLKTEKREMHVDEIATALVFKYPHILISSYPHIQISMDQLPQKVSGVLSTDISKNKNKSIFTKPKNKNGGLKRGIYRIKTPRGGYLKKLLYLSNQR